MRRALIPFVLAAIIAVQATTAVAAVRSAAAAKAVPTKKVVTQKFVGTPAQADRWGDVQVTITIRKTMMVTAAGKKQVTRKMTDLSATYPDHAFRSQEINQQAGPLLRQEALQAQSSNINAISGATDSSYAFAQSLNAAILAALKA
jgi:uncharacterized protein with FMN-binding domain